MNQAKPLHISILVGRTGHPQAVIDDLWSRATRAADPAAWQVTGTAVQLCEDPAEPPRPVEGMQVVQIIAGDNMRLGAVLDALATRSGPIGMVGRLVRENVKSRQVARTLARHRDLLATFETSDVVVSADASADRAIWRLRKRTGAQLVHGPSAMVHAIRTLTGS